MIHGTAIFTYIKLIFIVNIFHHPMDPMRVWLCDLKKNFNPSFQYMGVSKNNGTPKSSIFIGFSIIFTIHFGGFTPYFWVDIHIETSLS